MQTTNRRQSNFLIGVMIVIALGWACHAAWFSVAHGSNVTLVDPMIPTSPATAPAFKNIQRSTFNAQQPIVKGATLLIGSTSLVRHTTNAPVRFLAVSRGPSPYDGLANVETILVGTVQLDGSVTWEVLQTGQTNRFIVGNTNAQQYFNMAFGFTQ